MDGIFSALREAALTLQQGGGIGYDFSTLRPKGAAGGGRGRGCLRSRLLHGCVGRDVPHHHERRLAPRRHDGDACAVDHPDIEDFITAKRTPGRLSNFNLSVLVSDAFMAAVKDGRRLGPAIRRARSIARSRRKALWDTIMRSTYDYAEPGVIFIDRINAAEQSGLLRNHCRHQSLRRAALAALWRLPAGFDQPGQAGAPSFHR